MLFGLHFCVCVNVNIPPPPTPHPPPDPEEPAEPLKKQETTRRLGARFATTTTTTATTPATTTTTTTSNYGESLVAHVCASALLMTSSCNSSEHDFIFLFPIKALLALNDSIRILVLAPTTHSRKTNTSIHVGCGLESLLASRIACSFVVGPVQENS